MQSADEASWTRIVRWLWTGSSTLPHLHSGGAACAESQRRRLLADVTHELRTPLSVIQGRLEGLRDGVYPRDDATLDAILDDTRHMSRIIEDLRVLSLAESGALRLTRGAIDVGEVADDVIDAYRGAAERGGIALESTCPRTCRPPTRTRRGCAR